MRQRTSSLRTARFAARLAVVSILLASAVSLAGDTPPNAFEYPPLFDRVEEYRLDNGMLFLLLPRHDLPTVSGNIQVRAGNVDNPIGKTGLAHMFEHMAFKGTDRIGTTDWEAEREVLDSLEKVGESLARETGLRERGDPARIAELRAILDSLSAREAEYVIPMEFPRLYDGVSLFFNAGTSVDFTYYYADFPANNLEAWMLMESERFQHPVFREFFTERNVVMEERRQVVEDQPMSLARETAMQLAFSSHPYRFPTIGFMGDIEILTIADARRFHDTYYVPNNAIAALVGDFDTAEAKRLIDAYFGDIPAGTPPPEVTVVEPQRYGPMRAEVRRGTERSVILCFPGYGPDDPRGHTALFLSYLLGRDNTSRLKHRLDIEEGIARMVSVSPTGGYSRYPGLFRIQVDLLENRTAKEAERMIWEELRRVVDEPPTEEDIDRIRRSLRKRWYFQLETNSELGWMLVGGQSVRGDWRSAYEKFREYEEVTPEAVVELARDLFREEQSITVILEPEENTGKEGA